MKSIMYVAMVWLMLGVLISFVALKRKGVCQIDISPFLLYIILITERTI